MTGLSPSGTRSGPVSTTFAVAGTPKGKARPRFNTKTGRTYSTADTRNAEARIREAWDQAGGIDLGDGPLTMNLVVVMCRPQAHFLRSGALSKSGMASKVPVRKPDLDNVIKSVADSLNECAYKDDAQIVAVSATRRWGFAGEREHIQVSIRRWDA